MIIRLLINLGLAFVLARGVGLGGFGGIILLISGVVVVLVLDEQPQRLRRSGQNADGAGSSGPDRIGVAADGEDFGDPVDRGHKPDGITGCSFGHNGFQPVRGVSDVLCKRFGLIVGPWASRKGTSLCQHWTRKLNR
jgi:hypothetical protein